MLKLDFPAEMGTTSLGRGGEISRQIVDFITAGRARTENRWRISEEETDKGMGARSAVVHARTMRDFGLILSGS